MTPLDGASTHMNVMMACVYLLHISLIVWIRWLDSCTYKKTKQTRNEYLWKYQKIPWINVFVQSPKNLIKLYGISNKFPAVPTAWYNMACSALQNLCLCSFCVECGDYTKHNNGEAFPFSHGSNESNVNFNLALVLCINYLPIDY